MISSCFIISYSRLYKDKVVKVLSSNYKTLLTLKLQRRNGKQESTNVAKLTEIAIS